MAYIRRRHGLFMRDSRRTPQLLFGDFTKDGKTDVLGVDEDRWEIVPGGSSSWQPHGPARATNFQRLVVADFDGDGFSDVAGTGASSWRVSLRGQEDWPTLRSSDVEIADQAIGRVDGNASADVVVWSGFYFDYFSSARDPSGRLSRQMMR
jgi:hypothetical protein